MSTKLRLVTYAFFGVCAANACGDVKQPIISTRELDTLSVLSSGSTFVIAALAPLEDCKVLVSGRDWGKLAIVDSTGKVLDERHSLLSPGAIIVFKPTKTGRLVALARDPLRLALIDPSTLQGEELALSSALEQVGDLAISRDGSLAFSRFGESSHLLRLDSTGSTEWGLAVGDSTGAEVTEVSRLEIGSGRYTSSLVGRQAIGFRGDTLVSLALFDGLLRRFINREGGKWFLEREKKLRRLLPRSEPVERYDDREWISAGSGVRISHLPEIISASFSIEGDHVFVLRAAQARRDPSVTSWLATAKDWEVEARVLEMYTSYAEFVAAFVVSPSTRRITAGLNGLLFLHDSAGSVTFVRSTDPPPSAPPSCTWPSRFRVDARDDEPAPPIGSLSAK